MIPEELELAWVFMKLIVAWILSFTTFYTILSLVFEDERKKTIVTFSMCMSIFCFQAVAELLNHLSVYVACASLSVFLLALIYEACKRR